MKKTIIAAALSAAVAAPAAMAEISMYGLAHMDLEDGTISDRTSILGFKGSEDMGNGMSAGFLYETQINFTESFGDAEGAFHNGRQAYVHVGGDFGKVMAGYLYFPTKGLFGFSKTEINGDSVADNSPYLLAEPKGSGIGYTNNFGGVTVTVGCGNGNATQMNSYKAPTTAGTVDVCDTTDMSATGSFGGVNVGIANYSADGEDDVMSLAANTTVGDLTVGAIYQTEDNATDDDALIISATYAMGANKIAVSRGEKSVGVTDTDSTNVSLTHSMSKQTSLYFAMDDAGDRTAFGIKHKF
jgi:predicted porin